MVPDREPYRVKGSGTARNDGDRKKVSIERRLNKSSPLDGGKAQIKRKWYTSERLEECFPGAACSTNTDLERQR